VIVEALLPSPKVNVEVQLIIAGPPVLAVAAVPIVNVAAPVKLNVVAFFCIGAA
jgi:hypothetical protein